MRTDKNWEPIRKVFRFFDLHIKSLKKGKKSLVLFTGRSIILLFSIIIPML